MRFFAIASVLSIVALCVFSNPVVEHETPKSVAVILTSLADTVTPLAYQLLYATRENATKETLTPIINNINTAVTGSVGSLKLLVGQPTNVIMTSVDGTTILGADDIATLLTEVVDLIFKAADAVLSVVKSEIIGIINPLVTALCQVVFTLLSVVLSLVTGLLPPLLALLAPVLSIISNLGLLGTLAKLLGSLL